MTTLKCFGQDAHSTDAGRRGGDYSHRDPAGAVPVLNIREYGGLAGGRAVAAGLSEWSVAAAVDGRREDLRLAVDGRRVDLTAGKCCRGSCPEVAAAAAGRQAGRQAGSGGCAAVGRQQGGVCSSTSWRGAVKRVAAYYIRSAVKRAVRALTRASLGAHRPAA